MEEDVFKDYAICVELDDEEVEQIRDGRITQIGVEINEDNQFRLLESPDSNHSCFFYNHGIFPYQIKKTLDFIGVNGEHDCCFTKIVDVEVVPGTRFHYEGSDVPITEDPNGDSCVWEVHFEVVPVLQDTRCFLMRWDPAISSFTEKDYEVCVENMERGMFRLDWSIFDWQEAKRGDFFYMMRTGDEQPGIVFNGLLLSDPYPMEDLTGNAERKMYVDVVCMNVSEPGETPQIPLRELQAAIPDFDWEKGHSGVLLSSDATDRLAELWHPDQGLVNLFTDPYVN